MRSAHSCGFIWHRKLQDKYHQVMCFVLFLFCIFTRCLFVFIAVSEWLLLLFPDLSFSTKNLSQCDSHSLSRCDLEVCAQFTLFIYFFIYYYYYYFFFFFFLPVSYLLIKLYIFSYIFF